MNSDLTNRCQEEWEKFEKDQRNKRSRIWSQIDAKDAFETAWNKRSEYPLKEEK